RPPSTARTPPRRDHAEGGDDVLAEQLVLIVAPDHHDVRGELVECGAHAVTPGHERGPVVRGRREAVAIELLAHAVGPAFTTLDRVGHARVCERELQGT